MSGLPEGWEADYDGRRWFYTYQPNGRTQYHFPSEGDEFPDFVDPASPAPNLAPEERLQSQQQVKRQSSSQTGRLSARNLGSHWDGHGRGANFSDSQSHKDHPVGLILTESRDRKETHATVEVFQPESLMFLGPSAYNDVSPLEDENEGEEEAVARRTISGNGRSTGQLYREVEGRKYATDSSDNHDHDTSPFIKSAEGAGNDAKVVHGGSMSHNGHIRTEREALSRPDPAGHRTDPVGRIAEMASEDTARAYIETNPDPVEAPDHSILAPIELVPSTCVAELAATHKAYDYGSRPALFVTTMSDRNKIMPHGGNGTEPRPDGGSEGQQGSSTIRDQVPQGHIRVPRKKVQTPGTFDLDSKQYQPYHPSHASPPMVSGHRKQGHSLAGGHNSLQREDSLMIGRGVDSDRVLVTVPSVLATPKAQPKTSPVQQQTQYLSKSDGLPVDTVRCQSRAETPQETSLATTATCPSILRPAVHNPTSQSGSTAAAGRPYHGEASISTETRIDNLVNAVPLESSSSSWTPGHEQPSSIPPYPCSPVLAQREPLSAAAGHSFPQSVPLYQPPYLAMGPGLDIQRRPSAISRKAVPDRNPVLDMSIADAHHQPASVNGALRRKPCPVSPVVAPVSSRAQSLSAGILPPEWPFDAPSVSSPSSTILSVPAWTRRLGKQVKAARFSRSTSLHLGQAVENRRPDSLGNMMAGSSLNGQNVPLEQSTARPVEEPSSHMQYPPQQSAADLRSSYSPVTLSSIPRKAVQSMQTLDHTTHCHPDLASCKNNTR